MNKNEKRELIKNKILKSAIKLYKKQKDVTVRDICGACNVNVAAINYYFGSKTNLYDEIRIFYIKGLIDVFENVFNNNTYKTNKDKLVEFGISFFNYYKEVPYIFNLFNIPAINDNDNEAMKSFLKSSFDIKIKNYITNAIKEETNEPESILIQKYIIFMSSSMFMCGLYFKQNDKSLDKCDQLIQVTKEWLKDYYITLVNSLLSSS